MVNKYNVVEILGAVEDIVQPKENLKDVQKEVAQEDEAVSSSKAAAFAIDEIQKITPDFEIDEIQKIIPEPKEKVEQNDKFAMKEKSSNAIPPETEKLKTIAEESLEINESEKKDETLILTNLYEIPDKLKKDKASKVLETQNDPKTESQITKLDNELSSSKSEEKSSDAIPPETEKLVTIAEESLEINKSEKKDEPLILTNTQKTEDVLKSKVTHEILETQNNPKTKSQITNLDNELTSSTKHITLLKDELKIQSGLIRTQQNKIREYQERISNLKERISKFEGQENKLYEENAQLKENLKRVSKEIKPQNDINDKMLEAVKRIKYYQEDNLRLSSELVTLSKRFDNTKHQLVSYESNKQQIMSEIKNLNNVISQSNIINNKFGSTILESDKIIINNDGKITKKVDQKVENTDDINRLVKEIFKK